LEEGFEKKKSEGFGFEAGPDGADQSMGIAVEGLY
jgi:hypothetical protein